MDGYYPAHRDTLKDIFDAERVHISTDKLEVDGINYPIIDDVIILLEPSEYTPYIKSILGTDGRTHDDGNRDEIQFSEAIQNSFGSEWTEFDKILPEHEEEFQLYFDIVDIKSLSEKRVLDLGCGIGRWTHFLVKDVKEALLIDFSDSIFVARRNLKDCPNALFFMGNLEKIPFRDDCVDFLFCLGVLHHLPRPCLSKVRELKPIASEILIYLYYALDNKPFYFRISLFVVTFLRKTLSRIREHRTRKMIAGLIAAVVYMPLVGIGHALNLFGMGRFVPLFEGYRGKSFHRISQDSYDRFFTDIEQRVKYKDVLALEDSFSRVTISENIPYWHFLCQR